MQRAAGCDIAIGIDGVAADPQMVAGQRGIARALQRGLQLRRTPRHRQIPIRRQLQIAGIGGHGGIQAHSHTRRAAYHLNLAGRDGTVSGGVNRIGTRRAVGRHRCGGVRAAVAGGAVGGAAAGIDRVRCDQLIAGDHIDFIACVKRRVDADGFRDQVDGADGAVDADAGTIGAGVAFDLDMAAGDVIGHRLGAVETGGAAAYLGQELRHAGGQGDAEGIGKRRALRGNPVGVGDDHRSRCAEHFQRAVQGAGKGATGGGHLIDNHAGAA